METLKKNRDFKRVYSRGKSRATSNLVIYWYSNQLDYNRYGFSISKKVGKAVVRNKLRRRLKEILREYENRHILRGYDIIFIARKPVVDLDFQGIKMDVKKLLDKARLWKTD